MNEDTYSYYMQNKYSSCYAVYVTDTVSDDSVEITEIPVQLNEFINKMCLNEELVINKTVMTHLNELKEKYQLIDTIESRFNRMVLFNGQKLTHGMSINSEKFFNDLRINQVVFLKP